MRRAAAFFAPLILAGPLEPAKAAEPAFDTITIDVGHTAIVCVGFCPVFTVTVRSDDSIELIAPPRSDFDRQRTRIQRWQGRRGDFARMQSILSLLRPAGDVPVGPPCSGDLCYEPRPYRYIISWRDAGRADRLTTNGVGDNNFYCRVWRAVADLGVDVHRRRRDDSRRGWPLSSFCDPILGESH